MSARNVSQALALMHEEFDPLAGLENKKHSVAADLVALDLRSALRCRLLQYLHVHCCWSFPLADASVLLTPLPVGRKGYSGLVDSLEYQMPVGKSV